MYAYKSTQLSGLLCLWQCLLSSIQHFIDGKSGKYFYILYGSRLKREQQLKWPARNYLYCPSWDVSPVPPSCSQQCIRRGDQLGQNSKHLSSYFVLLCDFPTQRLHDIIDLGTFWKRSKLKSKFPNWKTLILAINYFVTMMMCTVQGNKKCGRILNMRRLTLSLSTEQYIWHKEQAFDHRHISHGLKDDRMIQLYV